MNPLVRLLVLSLVASSTLAIPAPERADPDADVALPKTNLHDYIHRIDEDSIQHALRLFDKYRHGASRPESESSQEDSAVARMNLVKRSPANSSAAVDPTQATSAPSTQAPTTTSDSSSSSSSSSQDDSTSVASTPTTTTQAPTSTTTTAATTTSSSSSETTSSSPSSASTTRPTSQPTSASSTSSSTSTSESQSEKSSSSKTTTDEPTTAPTTTEGPRTTTYKSTTTLPNGQQSTVTRVTVIHPTQTATAASRTGPAPGLQTDSAASTATFARELWLMVGGAALVAMAL